MKTNSKKLVVLAFAAAMVALLCSACAQQPASENAEKGMYQATNALRSSSSIVVDANEEGSYTVNITNGNILEDERYAEDLSGAVTPEEAAEFENEAPGTGKWSLSNVKQEDITVCYREPASGEEGETV